MRNIILVVSLLCSCTICFASSSFTTNNGHLTISNLSIDGNTTYSNVTLQLDIANGTFEILDLTPKASTISQTPLSSFEQQDLKFEFFGCSRSGLNQVSCHVDVTNYLNDRDLIISGFPGSILFDNSGRYYFPIITVFEETGGSITTTLIQGIPVRVIYVFDNISINATSFAAFMPAYRIFPSTSDTVIQGDFRKISF